jgi:diamine N-acetyltransferase
LNQFDLIPSDRTDELLDLLHESFGTVAKEFNLTVENASSNAAFVLKEKLVEEIQQGLEMYGVLKDKKLVGCVGVKKSKTEGVYYIERLCVASPQRHNGIGKALLDSACNLIKRKDGKGISIGIINENKRLKSWYERNGFKEYEVKKYDHLSFTTCLMKMEL